MPKTELLVGVNLYIDDSFYEFIFGRKRFGHIVSFFRKNNDLGAKEKMKILSLFTLWSYLFTHESLAQNCLCSSETNFFNKEAISNNRSLFITNPSVLSEISSTGKEFSFGALLEQMKPPGMQLSQFYMKFLDGFVHSNSKAGVTLNELTPRNTTRLKIARAWSKLSPSQLNTAVQTDLSGLSLSKDLAPYKLVAVVFRPDLVGFDEKKEMNVGGEGRFIFKYIGEGDLSFSSPGRTQHIILEYKLPIDFPLGKSKGLTQVGWSKRFADLECLTLGSKPYIDHLKETLRLFTSTKYEKVRRGTVPLGQFRVNDFLQSPWMMIEYKLDFDKGLVRTQMPQQPKDNLGELVASNLRHGNQNFSTSLQSEFIEELDKIKGQIINNEEYDFSKKFKSWETTYSGNSAWNREVFQNLAYNFKMGLSTRDLATLSYRLSLNTCNSCHSGTFSGNQPMIAQLDPALGFLSITRNNSFLHVSSSGAPSDFTKEDLENRASLLSDTIGINLCMQRESTDLLRCNIDYNNDLCFSLEDIKFLRDVVSGKQQSNPNKRFDLNGDGKINEADVFVIEEIGKGNLSASEGILGCSKVFPL